jgi:hypothetical protein
MLMLLQAAAQQLPPINVTVQPPAVGMPEWVKILISASTGALFGILGNIAMEYVKPWIAARVLTKRISRELADELLANARCAATAIHIIEDAENRADPVFAAKARETMPLLLVNIHKDRFAQYFEHEKTTVYAIDRQGFLRDFYEASSHLKRALATDDITLIRLPCMLMIHYGKQYAEAHRHALPAIDDFWFKSYLAMPDDGTLPILE